MSESILSLADLYQARYGVSAPEGEGTANAVVSALLSHKSVRTFRPDPLTTGALEQIVAAAQSAATSSNLQTWSVVAIEDPEHKSTVADLCGKQEFIRRAPLFLVFCADLARLTAISEKAGLPGEGLEYLEMFLMAVIDAALAAQNAAVAAESLGLGICYVGAARNQPRELAKALHLPKRVFGVFGLAVGYPTESDTSTVKPRLPQSAVLHRETYDANASEDAVRQYNATMRTFYDAQGMKVPDDWMHHSARRVATVASLVGRHLLREILEENGFELK